jgi:hypothetical protein
MKTKTVFVFVVLFQIICCLSASAQKSDTTILEVNKTEDFTLSGDGTAMNWRNEKWVVLPKRDNTGPPYETKMKILYSDSGIYCLYQCEDLALTSTFKKDFSDLYDEDVVEAFFWPDESLPVYFEYELSPYNYELPLMVPNINGNFMGWLPNHYVGNRKTRHISSIIRLNNKLTGWTAEFFIPYTLMKPLVKSIPSKNTRWRANFYRIDYDYGDAGWSWQSVDTYFHDYQHFGELLFK